MNRVIQLQPCRWEGYEGRWMLVGVDGAQQWHDVFTTKGQARRQIPRFAREFCGWERGTYTITTDE